MLEYSFYQLCGVVDCIIKFFEDSKIPDDQLRLVRVRLHSPKDNGDVSFDFHLRDSLT